MPRRFRRRRRRRGWGFLEAQPPDFASPIVSGERVGEAPIAPRGSRSGAAPSRSGWGFSRVAVRSVQVGAPPALADLLLELLLVLLELLLELHARGARRRDAPRFIGPVRQQRFECREIVATKDVGPFARFVR